MVTPGLVAGDPTQEFSAYVGDLFREIQPDTVVEVGPDNALSLMPKLGRLCGRYVAITLPEDFERAKGLFAIHQDMGVGNVELISGNAVDLPELVPKADVIMIHNVLLDLTGEDTRRMWAHRRGEQPLDEEEIAKIKDRFAYARGKSYQGFMEVASDGRILTFHRAQSTEGFIEGLTSVVGVDSRKISVVSLLYDGGVATDEAWDLVTIDNTSADAATDVPTSEHKEAGTPVTRGTSPRPAKVPGAELSSEGSRKLQQTLAAINRSETDPGSYR